MKKRFITSRLLVTLLVAMMAVCSYAQDSYREAVKECMSLSGDYAYRIERMKMALTQVNGSLFKTTEGVNMDELTERYIKECLVEEMIDNVEVKMKERGLSEGDLRQTCTLASTPEFKVYLAHQREWFEKVSLELNRAKESCPGLLDGSGVAEDVTIKPEIDAEYIAKFNEILEKDNIVERFKERLDNFFGLYDSLYEKLGKKEAAENIKNWLNNNIVTMALNSAYGIVTMDDLDCIIKMSSNEPFRITQNTSQLQNVDLITLGKELIMKYIAWMEAQGVQKCDNVDRIMQMMRNWGE